jgi:hypothetical protein
MPGRLVEILLIGIEKGIDGGDDMPGLCVRLKRSDGCSRRSYIRWRMERWGALECRLDVRDVDDSESGRDGSSFFVGLGRLLRDGGGPG